MVNESGIDRVLHHFVSTASFSGTMAYLTRTVSLMPNHKICFSKDIFTPLQIQSRALLAFCKNTRKEGTKRNPTIIAQTFSSNWYAGQVARWLWWSCLSSYASHLDRYIFSPSSRPPTNLYYIQFNQPPQSTKNSRRVQGFPLGLYHPPTVLTHSLTPTKRSSHKTLPRARTHNARSKYECENSIEQM